MKESPKLWIVLVAFGIIYFVWGSTYYFIQQAVKGFSPMLLGALRFLIAGVIMASWCLFRKEKLFDKEAIKPAMLTGFLLLFIGNGSIIWVEQTIPSSLVAIMVSSGPFWIVLLDYPRWKINLSSKLTIGGILLGFAGVVLLFGEQILNEAIPFALRPDWFALFLLVLAPFSWSLGSLVSKYKSKETSAFVTTSWQMLFAGFLFTCFALIRGEHHAFQPQSISISAWFSLFYLIVLGSIAGFTAYVWLLKVRPAAQVSTNAYVNPLVAIILGVYFAGEHITSYQIIGLVIILASVFLINKGQNKL